MEVVKVIDDNQESLIWRLRLIAAAKTRIILFTFKMRDDNSGRDILSALAAAAERGVQEYILVDAISSWFHCKGSEHVRYLASFENVHFCFYNKVFFSNPFRVTFRLHDKILVIDDEIYMLGGRNILDVSIGNYVDKYNIDRDVVVLYKGEKEQASVSQILTYAEQMKKDRAVERFSGSLPAEQSSLIRERLATRYQAFCASHPEIKEPVTAGEEGFLPADEIRLISGDPDYRFKGLEIYSRLIRLMESGRDVLVQTPYIMCNRLMYQGLTEVIKADDSFAIITNAPEAGANYMGCADYMNQRKKIRDYGIRVYECSAGQSLHTKSILIDDDISVIGSFNFDTRSAYMDTELMLFIRSKELNRKLRDTAEDLIEKSRITGPDGTVTCGPRYVNKKMSFPLAAFYAILRVLVRPFRFLL